MQSLNILAAFKDVWDFAYFVVQKKFQKEHLHKHIFGLGIRLDNSDKQGREGFCPSLLQLRDVGGNSLFLL